MFHLNAELIKTCSWLLSKTCTKGENILGQVKFFSPMANGSNILDGRTLCRFLNEERSS